jgi:outer membrane receptor for ferrienterochelin and colicin
VGNGDDQTQLRSRIGGNPNLQPEKAKVFTLGAVIEPSVVRNLSVTVDYYNITIDNTITTIGESVILAGCYPTDAQVAAGATPKYCNLITRDLSTQRIVNIINLNTNVGQDKTDGIDLAVRYAVPSEYGRFTFIFDGTWLHKYNVTLADGSLIKGRGTFDLASRGTGGTGGTYPAFKFISGLRWNYAGFMAGLTTKFIGSFTECGNSDGGFLGDGLCYVPGGTTYTRQVGAYNTYDLYLSYAFPSSFGRTTFGAGVNNMFDRRPAAIYNGFLAATDAYNYDLMGRFGYLRLAHAF